MNNFLEQKEYTAGFGLTAWFPGDSTGLPLKERIDAFNVYLKRRAIETGIWVRPIEIQPHIWMRGDEAVLGEIREQLTGLVDRLPKPDQLPPGPEDQLLTHDV